MAGLETNNARLYGIYFLAVLAGLVIARFNAYAAMRYAFLYYLIGLFLFTGALPYIASGKRRGEPGWAWNVFVKIIFPIVAATGTALVVALLLKLRC